MAENDNQMPIFIAGRDDINLFKESGKFKERVEIYWKYTPSHNNMPSDDESRLMEEVMNSLQNAMEKDKLAILTGVYTGDCERTMVFYARTSKVFGERLNQALEQYPQLPIELYVEIDTEWCEYTEMCEIKPFAE